MYCKHRRQAELELVSKNMVIPRSREQIMLSGFSLILMGGGSAHLTTFCFFLFLLRISHTDTDHILVTWSKWGKNFQKEGCDMERNNGQKKKNSSERIKHLIVRECVSFTLERTVRKEYVTHQHSQVLCTGCKNTKAGQKPSRTQRVTCRERHATLL